MRELLFGAEAVLVPMPGLLGEGFGNHQSWEGFSLRYKESYKESFSYAGIIER